MSFCVVISLQKMVFNLLGPCSTCRPVLPHTLDTASIWQQMLSAGRWTVCSSMQTASILPMENHVQPHLYWLTMLMRWRGDCLRLWVGVGEASQASRAPKATVGSINAAIKVAINPPR